MSYLRKKGDFYTIEFRYMGKRYIRGLGVSALREAKHLQAAIDYQIATGKLDPEYLKTKIREETSLFELAEEYISFIKANGKRYSVKTIESYEQSAELIKQILGDTMLKRIDAKVVETKILPFLYDGYSYGSVRHYMIDFRSQFSKAVDWGYIGVNPFTGKVPKRKKRVPHYYKEDEIDRMEEYFANPNLPRWQGHITFLGMNTGLRKHELFNLDWEKYVDLANEQLVFPGKGDKDRVVPLNDRAMMIMYSRSRHIASTRVFWEIDSMSAIDSMWRRMRARTGIKGTFHDLRKTFASYYVMNGGSLARLMEILGHEDYETVQIYETLSPESLHRYKNIVGFGNNVKTGTM